VDVRESTAVKHVKREIFPKIQRGEGESLPKKTGGRYCGQGYNASLTRSKKYSVEMDAISFTRGGNFSTSKDLKISSGGKANQENRGGLQSFGKSYRLSKKNPPREESPRRKREGRYETTEKRQGPGGERVPSRSVRDRHRAENSKGIGVGRSTTCPKKLAEKKLNRLRHSQLGFWEQGNSLLISTG